MNDGRGGRERRGRTLLAGDIAILYDRASQRRIRIRIPSEEKNGIARPRPPAYSYRQQEYGPEAQSASLPARIPNILNFHPASEHQAAIIAVNTAILRSPDKPKNLSLSH